MKRRICSILASAALTLLALTACSSGGNNTESSTEAQSTVAQSSVAQSTAAASENTTNAVVVESVAKNKVYVSPQWVESLINGEQEESKDYVILECSWGEEADSEVYPKGHIPGAVHMNTDSIEEEVDWNIRKPDEIEKLLKDYGITKDTTVVCYSDKPEMSSDDRVAFMLLWAGVENVKCLDGGLEAWKKAGLALETQSNAPKATDKEFGATIPVHPEYIISIDDVKKELADNSNFRLVSIRSKDEFLGKTSGYSYIDRAGEPKGAVWGHDTDDGSYNNADGTTVGLDKLEEYLAESGSSINNDLAFYCGTGWRAAIPFLIAYENGHVTKLYDSGWFVWQKDPANEVQVGDPASGDVLYTTVGELSTDKAPKKK
jgi:rhodanese domain protein